MPRPALLLSGPPAAGKSSTGRLLALGRPSCAFVEVDDVRRLVISGAAAPWEGAEGSRQRSLGAANACALAQAFLAARIDVVIADVLSADTLLLYRERLPEVLVVHLDVGFATAVRRARARAIHLTWDEFAILHEEQRSIEGADLRIAVDSDTVDRTVARIEAIWSDPPNRPDRLRHGQNQQRGRPGP